MEGYYLKITDRGDTHIAPFPDKMQDCLAEWQQFCEGYVEEATPFGFSGQYKIICNEDGLYDRKSVVNYIASKLYGIDQHGHALVGNVCLVRVRWDYLEGCEKVEPMTIEQINYLLTEIIRLKKNMIGTGKESLGVWDD